MKYDSPICNDCLHWWPNKGNLICRAFPEGIPNVILKESNRHAKPLPGQKNKIVFEPIKEIE